MLFAAKLTHGLPVEPLEDRTTYTAPFIKGESTDQIAKPTLQGWAKSSSELPVKAGEAPGYFLPPTPFLGISCPPLPHTNWDLLIGICEGKIAELGVNKSKYPFEISTLFTSLLKPEVPGE